MFGKKEDFTKKDDDIKSKPGEVQLPLLAGHGNAAPHPGPDLGGSKMLFGLGCWPVQVPSGQVGMLENCGKFQTTLMPGLACTVCGFEKVKLVDLRTRQLNCNSDSKTKDNVTVHVSTAVTYRVNPQNVYAAAYTIAEPEQQIRSLIDDVIRSSLPMLTLDESYEAKAHIVHDLKDTVALGMAVYGYVAPRASPRRAFVSRACLTHPSLCALAVRAIAGTPSRMYSSPTCAPSLACCTR